ncbi:aromatic amino acid hydroxylase [Luteibaculum oceani]|uniref:Aromatic amino acid hydroxylase n=1 Tax=Luteibaculum oceani TaxID=1294296 RepID=A0A5C6UYI4_9FLAO|nr:aromatic amino acid hydroxylase [Luteibaculum oceani]TXC78482.1 aromatic amino acid hydroxylase [Luteibaculum oceani]
MDRGFEKNEVLEKLPSHLLDFVIDQPYNGYTSQDHAVWRYVMRQNVNYLGKVAHHSYLEGLKKTGISIDTIPHMYGMNRILKEIGWAAVAVDGFIPPQAFMEFQAYKVLVIAADIRNINHIQYTPAPDIIHEAAGHAPIIADPEYALYLKRFGEIGSKAFSSKKDFELYEAIRHLSIIKENPDTKESEVVEAEKHIEWLQANMGEPSEMSRIRNLHWWTVEYGLIGSVDDYKLYGAGLLSSIGESANCMREEVKKIPYSIAAADYSFDITTEQPQLFVTSSFQQLNEVLDEFASQMALNKGGEYALRTAIGSGAVASLKFGDLQLSGIIEEGELNEQFTWLRFGDRLGIFRDSGCLYLDEESEMDSVEVWIGKDAKNIKGSADAKYGFSLLELIPEEIDGPVVINHEDLGRHVFIIGDPELSGAYAGPADPKAWNLSFEPPKEKTLKINHSENAKRLHTYYNEVRNIRNQDGEVSRLMEIFEILKKDYPKDWLLPLEIYEILSKWELYPEYQTQIRACLEELKGNSKEYKKLITDGINLIEKDFNLIHQ